MNTFSLAPLILILPLAGLLINGLVGRRFVDANRESGERLTGWLATLMVLGALVVSITLFISLATHGFEAWFVPLFTWIDIPAAAFQVNWALQVDTLSVTMMLIVTGVGSLIHIYAIGYMHGDPDYSRFFTYFNLFIFFMLLLVSGSSYLVMFVGWEGVGLCSYLLIGFWFGRVDKNGLPANATAGRKAMVMNRIGDFGVLLAMFLLFWTFGTLDYTLFDIYMHTNALGPLKVAESFLPHVAASNLKKIVNISSSSGKVSQPPHHSGNMWYRASKTALNGLMVTIVPTARKVNVSVTMFEPGWTWTGQNEKNRLPGQLDAAQVVAEMIETIEGLTLEDTGRFLMRDGDTQPW